MGKSRAFLPAEDKWQLQRDFIADAVKAGADGSDAAYDCWIKSKLAAQQRALQDLPRLIASVTHPNRVHRLWALLGVHDGLQMRIEQTDVPSEQKIITGVLPRIRGKIRELTARLRKEKEKAALAAPTTSGSTVAPAEQQT